jgi:hypothetical protein
MLVLRILRRMHKVLDAIERHHDEQQDGEHVDAKQPESLHPGHSHDRSPPSMPDVPPGGHRAVQFAGFVSCNGAWGIDVS